MHHPCPAILRRRTMETITITMIKCKTTASFRSFQENRKSRIKASTRRIGEAITEIETMGLEEQTAGTTQGKTN